MDSNTTGEINGFSPRYSCTSVLFWTEFMMEYFEFVGAEDASLKMERIEKK